MHVPSSFFHSPLGPNLVARSEREVWVLVREAWVSEREMVAELRDWRAADVSERSEREGRKGKRKRAAFSDEKKGEERWERWKKGGGKGR